MKIKVLFPGDYVREVPAEVRVDGNPFGTGLASPRQRVCPIEMSGWVFREIVGQSHGCSWIAHRA